MKRRRTVVSSTIVKVAKETRCRILVLCTGNSARSIMAEALFNTLGANTFRAFSAGSKPTGKVNSLALEQIGQLNLPKTAEVRSKSWLEFTQQNAPTFDIVLTVCDNAAAEICPIFSGDYQHIHWGLEDPAGFSSDVETERVEFTRCFRMLKSRVADLALFAPVDQNFDDIINAMRDYK